MATTTTTETTETLKSLSTEAQTIAGNLQWLAMVTGDSMGVLREAHERLLAMGERLRVLSEQL